MNIKRDLHRHSDELDRISQYIETFNFPRLPGTDGEKRAIELTQKIFQVIGFKKEQIKKESFEFSTFYSKNLVRLIITFTLIIVFTLMLLLYISHILLFIIIGLSLAMMAMVLKDNKHPETDTFWNRHVGKDVSSSNVYIKIPCSENKNELAGNIILSAHIDSKSQTFTSYWRGKIYRTWIYSGLLFSLLYSIYSIYRHSSYTIIGIMVQSNLPRVLIVEYILWISFFLICLSNILLLVLKSGNKSTGALDNASGMAIVFELSRLFKDKPLKNFNLWLCQFSAEEMGTMGSRFFLKAHGHQFVKGKVFLINSDAVSDSHGGDNDRVEFVKSTKRFPKRQGSPTINKYLEQAAREEKLPIHGFHSTFGIHFDSLPFRLKDFDAIDIHTKSTKNYTHKQSDNPEKINPKTLYNVVRIVRKAVLLLDKNN